MMFISKTYDNDKIFVISVFQKDNVCKFNITSVELNKLSFIIIA